MEKHDGKIIDADAGEYDGKSLQYRLTLAEILEKHSTEFGEVLGPQKMPKVDADAGEYDGKSLQYRLTEAEKYFGVPLAALSHYAEDATTMLKHRGKTSLIDEIIEASIKVTPNPRCACIVAILITEKAERR